MAGTTLSDHSLRSRDIGEAVCRITWTPVGFIHGSSDERRKLRGGGARVVKMKKEKIWSVFIYLAERYNKVLNEKWLCQCN